MIDLSEYRLETIRKDDEFILYSGTRQTDATASSIFVLTPALEHPAVASLRGIEHEYSLQAELDPDWAVIPIGLVKHDGRTMLVLANSGGDPLDRFIGTPLELRQFLRLAIGLSAALGRLHERGLVHKDIKPSNVLINSATGQVWLTGFGIASRLLREHQAPEPPEFLAGTLPYMAPEQTGRMNRSIDSRSDLYAFGIMLYEMLTGDLPFSASDPMEWVHCHVARQPVSPSERLSGVPGSVSAIIMKLLAKTAEERYQTAVGAESDLRRCLAQLETQGRIDEFPLGEHDTPDRLLIPEKLYGRTSETEILLTSFDRVVAGNRPELVLVSGYSGIGKSAVVNELHKPLVPPRGLFASGKFDQYKRDIPYATLAQAFQNPFFALQFFSALAEEGLLTFDHGKGQWSWDLNRIHAKGYTDNVVDLMVGKLNRLPVETQNALQQLACLGNSAEFATLMMVYQQSQEEMHGKLWEAVRAGLIFRSEDS